MCQDVIMAGATIAQQQPQSRDLFMARSPAQPFSQHAVSAPLLQAGQTILVTGPARSGKSGWAESLAARSPHPVTYIATARPLPDDAEWTQRIQQHRDRRPPHWLTREVPEALTASLDTAQANQCLLIDSLGTWVANGIEQPEEDWQTEAQALTAAIARCAALVILVAEETGWGVVPAYALGRRFRDRLGQLSQTIGSQADAVYLVTAGHALPLHQLGIPLA